jgi:hypothetical protein
MKYSVTIELDAATPARTWAILRTHPWLEVRQGGTRPTMATPAIRCRLVVVANPSPKPSVSVPHIRALTTSDEIALVVDERLSTAMRVALEEAGCSYADGIGHLHLDLPGMLLHSESAPRTPGMIPPPRGVGTVGVRVVQELLGQPAHPWSVTELSRTSGASIGQAHNVLQRLEREGLMVASGSGPARRRRVAQPGDLLDWLARVPSARKVHARLNTYLYAPDPASLVDRLSSTAARSGAVWALTGAAAARAMGIATVTALGIVMVRVPSQPGLVDAARLFGADPVDSGANVTLVSDVGAVGTQHVQRYGPVSVAPAVRIYLDMLGEPRGREAADLFREAAIGY